MSCNTLLSIKNNNNFEIIYEDIYLRPINIEDIELIREWRNNEAKNNYFLNSGYIESNQQLEWFNDYMKKNDDIMFIILYKNNKVGIVAMYNIEFLNKTAEFGRLLVADKNYRGKNIGCKATIAICKYFIDNFNLKEILLEVFEENLPAVKVYKKVGFNKYGQRIYKNKRLLLMNILSTDKIGR